MIYVNNTHYTYTVIPRFTVLFGGKQKCTVYGGPGKSEEYHSGPEIGLNSPLKGLSTVFLLFKRF